MGAEFSAAAAGPLDPDRQDRPKGGDVVDDRSIACRVGQEFLLGKVFAVLIYHGDMMGVGVSIDTCNDTGGFICHDGTGSSTGVVTHLMGSTSARWADKTVMGLFVKLL